MPPPLRNTEPPIGIIEPPHGIAARPFPLLNNLLPGISLPEYPRRIVLTPRPNAYYPHLRSVLPERQRPLFIGTDKSKTENSAPDCRISDIFRAEGKRLIRSGKLTPEQGKAVFSIMNCRTATYGYHADVCDECGFIEVAYNSCRNRHCPQCQGTAKRRWVNARLNELLPAPYHHVVFTVPAYISKLSLYNQKLIFDLLFQSASQTLLAFGRDPKFLGAELGFYGILHTWSQTLGPHIHIHFIVTAGGLTADGQWKEAKHGKKFLFPVRAVSKVFRGKFISGLKKLYCDDELTIPDRMEELKTREGFEKELNRLVSKSWRVYSKPPFSGPDEVVRYIGRYTHRIAITDSRILSLEDGQVTFSYKDNKEKDPDKKRKTMTLSSEEFVRRFLYHILPDGYHRIRNYGFLSNGRKKQNIAIILEHLPQTDTAVPAAEEEAALCPACGKGKMRNFLVVDGYGQITEYDAAALDKFKDTS